MQSGKKYDDFVYDQKVKQDQELANRHFNPIYYQEFNECLQSFPGSQKTSQTGLRDVKLSYILQGLRGDERMFNKNFSQEELDLANKSYNFSKICSQDKSLYTISSRNNRDEFYIDTNSDKLIQKDYDEGKNIREFENNRLQYLNDNRQIFIPTDAMLTGIDSKMLHREMYQDKL